MAADRGDLRVRILPDVKGADGVLRHALELSSTKLDPLVFHIDPVTGLIAKQSYVVRAPGQPLVEESFSDYRRIDGVNVAFEAEVRSNGRSILTRHLSSITIGRAPLDPKLFTRPTS
jgi:hypothetical protein